jgi:hypothetical protein
LSIIFKKRIINDLFTKYDFIKTLIQENQKNSDNEDEISPNYSDNIGKNKKKCMKIIERLKFIFDQFRNNYDRTIKNLAVSIDKFLVKRKIDIRADFKSVTNKIKENESLNAQRNKDIKNTLEELKYQIKGYSAKKEQNNIIFEENKIKGKKINFDEINDKTIIKEKEKKEIDKNEIIEVIEDDKEKKDIIKNEIIEVTEDDEEKKEKEEKEGKEEKKLKEDKEGKEVEKEEKKNGKKRLRDNKKKKEKKKE